MPADQNLRPWTWPRLLVVTAAKSLVAGLLGLAAWAALPAVIGWHPTTVSSGSMLPRLHIGDIAVSRPLGRHQPTIGSVLLFDDPDHAGRLRMHRFVALGADGQLVTRGDANPDNDSSPVPLSSVRGVGTLRVPWIGLPIVWLREGRWLPLGLTALGFVLVLGATQAGRDRDADEPPDDGPLDGPPDTEPATAEEPAGRTSRTPSGAVRRTAVAGAAALLLAGLAAPAQAAFRGTTSTVASLAAEPWFSCANAVSALTPNLWYRMDETTSLATSATDSSANGRAGTYGLLGKTSVTTKACARDTGRAMTYNGSSGYLSSPQVGALPNTFSLSIWFRTTTKAGGKLIGFGTSQTGVSTNYDRHIYMTNAGLLVFGVYPGDYRTLSTTAACNDGAWHLAVATLSSAGMRFYVDGSLVGSDDKTTSGESVAAGYLRVAYDNLDTWPSAPSSRYFSGTLDDAAWYPTALTAAQAQDLYDAGT